MDVHRIPRLIREAGSSRSRTIPWSAEAREQETREHGTLADPASVSRPPAAESRTSSRTSQIRCIWIPRDHMRWKRNAPSAEPNGYGSWRAEGRTGASPALRAGRRLAETPARPVSRVQIRVCSKCDNLPTAIIERHPRTSDRLYGEGDLACTEITAWGRREHGRRPRKGWLDGHRREETARGLRRPRAVQAGRVRDALVGRGRGGRGRSSDPRGGRLGGLRAETRGGALGPRDAGRFDGSL